ncbi:MAG TPA: molybdopterin-binding protein [Myxococcota bacterium]|nr:molybdopterin-binding protein [Myxococcota bacterium]
MPENTAAILLIGNELLTGKTADSNAHWLAGRLFALGARVKRIEVIPDDVPTIAEAVRRLAAAHTWLFTSGGVGPTHDDMTIPGVAAAFERKIVRIAELADGLRRFYGSAVTDGHLRMADAPEGYRLIASFDTRFPVLAYENVFVFPGVPELFRKKFEAVEHLFRGEPIHLRQIFLLTDEGRIAALLADAEQRHPGVAIGSYPSFTNPTYRVKVTMEGRSLPDVEAARDFVLGGLLDGELVGDEQVKL